MRTRFLAFFLLCLFAFFPVSVGACTPPRPDPWYTIRVDIDESLLSSAVRIMKTNQLNSIATINNDGQIPLYLVNLYPENPQKTYSNSELPARIQPLYKLINGDVYRYISGAWTPFRKSLKKTKDPLYIDESLLKEMGQNVKTGNVYADDRPVEQQPPGAQAFHITGYYNNQPLIINGTVIYSLNRDYDPKKTTNGLKGCGTTNAIISLLFPLVLTAVIILTSIVGMGYIYKKIRRRR